MRYRKQSGWGRPVAIAALVFAAALFSFLNAGERVALHLGLTVLYRVSVVGVVFVAFLLGMLAMFFFGLRQDRRVRDALRDAQAPRPRGDH